MTRSKKRFFILICIASFGLFVTVGLNWNALVIEYKLLRDFKSLGLNEQGYPEYVHLKSGIVMVLLPGGAFMMGSPENEEGRDPNEGPVHKVKVSSFLISKYEVTQAQWEEVMGNNPSEFIGEDMPVEMVSWNDCKYFCDQMELLLPTEAQWEYACRTGINEPFNFGDNITNKDCNFDGGIPYKGIVSGRKRRMTLPVSFFKPNQFGLFNMHGNVKEWCLDLFDESYYSSKQASDGDVACSTGSKGRVIRGGSWTDGPYYCRSASRGWGMPTSKLGFIGFRPVWNFK